MAAKKNAKKTATKKKPVKKSGSSRTKAVRKKPAKKKPAAKKASRKKAPARKIAAKKSSRPKKATPPKKRKRSRGAADSVTTPEQPRNRFGGQSGDLQGLSDVQGADSESVDELLEEGNSFEADVISGVERAGDFEEEEVHTHEVPEDDVPGEYLDEK